MQFLDNLYKNHIKGTPPGSIVVNKTIFLCQLTNATIKALGLTGNRIYINTKVLKHLYDKKPAEEFDFIIAYAHKIVKYPDTIYKNKSPKRGDYGFIKKIKSNDYFCSIENLGENCFKIVTIFRVRKQSYLKDYTVLWSWEGDNPPS